MEIANVRLRLTKVGSDVPIQGVTPAEAMLLHILHGPSNGGLSFGEEFKNITVVGTAKVQVKAAIPEEREEDFTTPATAEQRIPGSKPGEADKIIPAKPPQLVRGKVLKPAVPAVLRDRTNAEERKRLAQKYQARNKDNKPIIDEVWPDKISPNLPQTFDKIPWAAASGANIEAIPVNYVTGSVDSKQE